MPRIKPGRTIRYPWDKWFKQKSFTINRGKDFHCMTHGMASQIRNQASTRGISVSIQILSDKQIHVTRK